MKLTIAQMALGKNGETLWVRSTTYHTEYFDVVGTDNSYSILTSMEHKPISEKSIKRSDFSLASLADDEYSRRIAWGLRADSGELISSGHETIRRDGD